MADQDSVQVCVDLPDFAAPHLMGTLHRQAGTRGSVFSFRYAANWLEDSHAFAFDPDLALFEGPQYPAPDRGNFGVFLDSAPDRWGRVLMQRRENIRAREAQCSARALDDWDFLLGVHDETRLGALRFRRGEGERFLDDDPRLAAPPLTSLRALQGASLRLESGGQKPGEADQWLDELLVPGSSLGGARPKASVRDPAGRLCIAKFPSRHDQRDIGAWEVLAHRLAVRAGIHVPPSRPVRVAGSDHTTFLAERFDRTRENRRLPFVSAMTLTQRVDGERGASYLELLELLQTRGARPRRDCEQLFRRVLFNVLIHNTDDHLRNHGFFVGPEGLELSPAFDINPVPDRRHLTLAINEAETACEPAIALETCEHYDLTADEARSVLDEIQAAVATWQAEAESLQIPGAEQTQMAPAFNG